MPTGNGQQSLRAACGYESDEMDRGKRQRQGGLALDGFIPRRRGLLSVAQNLAKQRVAPDNGQRPCQAEEHPKCSLVART